MRENSTNKTVNIFVIISGILLLSYTTFRSASLSFTHDESYTYIKYINFSVWEIITYKINPVIANNHILNTLCMKWQSFIFGNSEFSLRLHSWIAHVFYIIFSYLILKETKSKTIIICGFILLNFNPYLLDYFSLARGYALSISLMLASVFCFIQYYNYSKNKFIYISLLTSVLAVFANFVMISYSLALILVFEFLFMKRKRTIKSFLQNNITVLMTLIVLVLIYRGPIKILADNNQLTFESDSANGFDTVITSIICYLYTSSYYEYLLIYFRAMVTLTSIGFIWMVFSQLRLKKISALSYISVLLFIILAFNFIQHQLFGSSYFRERFALFLVPLFFITFLNLILFLKNKNQALAILGGLLMFFTSLCSLTIFSTSANLSYTSTWRYDSDTKTMLDELPLYQERKQKLTLGITWLYEPTINFYRETKNYNWLEPVNRDGLNGDYDFYYVESADLNSFDTTNKTLLKSYPKSGATLYKARNNN